MTTVTPAATEVKDAFARNIAWLAKLDPVLPRHLLFAGWDVRQFGYRELAEELARWEPLLERLPTGDYRMTLAAKAQISFR